MVIKSVTFIIIFLSSVSCGGKEINKSLPTSDLKDTITLINKSTKGKQKLTEMELLKQVEDSGYPFATLTIEFPERNFSENFTINMEAVENASITDLNSYIGQYVKLTYTSEFTYALLDMYYASKSIFGSEVAPEGEGIKAIEGILYGAEQATSGDIPGEVSVYADDGEKHHFEYFITQEMVDVNEKRVTAFYDSRVTNTINAIQLVK